MPTIEDQIALEQRMVAFGVSRYNTGVTKAHEKNRGADTQSSQKLMQEFVLPVSDAIREHLEKTAGAGYNTKFKQLLKVIDPNKAAYLGLRAIFDFFTQQRPLLYLGSHIGMLIEDEAKFSRFHDANSDYYEAIVADFKKKGTKNYRHMHRVLTLKAKSKELKWNSWSNEEKAKVGIMVVDLIMQSTNLIERREEKVSGKKKWKPQITVVPTEECLDWIKKFDGYAELLQPDRTPCLIPPDPWTAPDQGGYYTPQLRLRTPLVKVRNKAHEKMFNSKMQPVLDAVNVIQATPWRINTEVLNVLNEAWSKSLTIGLPSADPYIISASPLAPGVHPDTLTEAQKEVFDEWKTEARIMHTLNKKRVSKCFQVIRVLRMANEYKDYERFYYVYYCDFRGRIYSSVHGLSPQGADFSKSLLRFAEGKPLTKTGLYWLKVHGANTYGKDKLDYAGREQWVTDNERLVLDVAEDPIGNHALWADADKPWQFLAFCFEYRRYRDEGLGMLTYLPIALDGSCNGLQNFSAMLRDSVGGMATNLVPSKVPADIYTEVANVLTRRLRESTHEMAGLWIDVCNRHWQGNIPRGLTKRPVMTLPYGSTQQSCREYIYQYLIEDAPDVFDNSTRFKQSVFLTPILWASINEVVVAARAGMDWIQQCASIIGKKNMAVHWVTPLGLPVYQQSFVSNTIRIRTELAGSVQLRMNVDSSKTDVHKMRLGASPNFIHSMDACHLMLTLLKAKELGVTDFACIHDDYGTNAEDTGKLHTALRRAFVEIYKNHNPLISFKELNESRIKESLPDMPPMGDLDIDLVLKSPYFFG